MQIPRQCHVRTSQPHQPSKDQAHAKAAAITCQNNRSPQRKNAHRPSRAPAKWPAQSSVRFLGSRARREPHRASHRPLRAPAFDPLNPRLPPLNHLPKIAGPPNAKNAHRPSRARQQSGPHSPLCGSWAPRTPRPHRASHRPSVRQPSAPKFRLTFLTRLRPLSHCTPPSAACPS